MRVAVAGGGTAGHIEPALNTADALVAAGVEVIALGTERGLEVTLVPARGYALQLIPAIPLPRRINRQLLSLPARALQAVAATKRILRDERIDVVIGFGGYVAVPAYLAARSLGIPIIVHEANAKAGLANRLGARFAAATFDTVGGSLANARTIGIPVRRALLELDRSVLREEALTMFGLREDRLTLLVFGGSQGARHINEIVGESAQMIVDEGWQILHAVGPKNADHLIDDIPHYRCVPYIDRMDLAYAIADAAVTRAGAMTVAELACVGVPTVYVPLPIGNGEQRRNALGIVEAGGALLIADAELTAATLMRALLPWLQDEAARNRAAEAGRIASSHDAAGIMVETVLGLGSAK